MAHYDPNSSRMARLIFGQASKPGTLLSDVDFARFLPSNPFNFYQPVARAYLSDSDGAQAEVEILTDARNGIYSANVTTVMGETTLRSELRISIHGNPARPNFRIDRLMVDNERIDLANPEAAQAGLLTFLAYKNAAFPTGDGPRADFPRPNGPQAPTKSGPQHDPTPQRPNPRGH